MNILQKAYNKIKKKIKFAFFERKFNSWYEERDIQIIERMNDAKDGMFCWLIEEDFNAAFYDYKLVQEALCEKEQLENFKKYVLNNENDEH